MFKEERSERMFHCGVTVDIETVCVSDEGFLAGLLGEYAGGKFDAKEVDCCCSGDRAYRFTVEQLPAE